MKVVINRCHGGFSLSHEAIMLFAEKKGMKLFPKEGEYGFITYWTLPPEKRKELNKTYAEETFFHRDVSRDDPNLVAVVQELGSAANGKFAALEIIEIPDDVDWEVQEYDGLEWIAEKHRTWP